MITKTMYYRLNISSHVVNKHTLGAKMHLKEKAGWPVIHCVASLSISEVQYNIMGQCVESLYFDNMRGSDLSVSRDQFKNLATKTAN